MWTGKLKMGKAPKIKSLQKGVQAIRAWVAQLAFLNLNIAIAGYENQIIFSIKKRFKLFFFLQMNIEIIFPPNEHLNNFPECQCGRKFKDCLQTST